MKLATFFLLELIAIRQNQCVILKRLKNKGKATQDTFQNIAYVNSYF